MAELSADECAQVRALTRDNLQPATVGPPVKALLQPKARHAEYWRVPEGCEAWEILQRAAEFFEAQVVRYGPGGHYIWHSDRSPSNGRNRTAVVLLNDPADFDGGQLEVVRHPGDSPAHAERPVLELGVPFMFPAVSAHKVNEVTRGERWTAVLWS